MSNGIFRSTTIRVDDAASFINEFYPTSQTSIGGNNNLYCCIGREDNPVGNIPGTNTPYGSNAGLWPNDAVPPVPADTLGNDQVFWSMIIGGQLVPYNQIALVVPFGPNTNWVSGVGYDKWDVNNANLYINANFYALNATGEVFLCVNNNSSALSTIQPAFAANYSSLQTGTVSLGFDTTTVATGNYNLFNDGTKSIITTTDGYIWKYLYTLNTWEINNILQSNWLPVHYGLNRWARGGNFSGALTDIQATQSQDYIDTLYGGSVDTVNSKTGVAYKILGARYAIITTTLQAGAQSSGQLPYGLKYRQTALIKNPRSAAVGNPVASFSVGLQPNSVDNSGQLGTAGSFLVPSGDIQYIENKSPITRVSGQTEVFKIVVSF